jgi:hypothetical protein
MRKLKLSLDALQVDSFEANGNKSLRGTVPANEWTQIADESCFGTCESDCTRNASCQGQCGTGASCYGTCYASCNGTCNCTGATVCGCNTNETCPGAPICS